MNFNCLLILRGWVTKFTCVRTIILEIMRKIHFETLQFRLDHFDKHFDRNRTPQTIVGFVVQVADFNCNILQLAQVNDDPVTSIFLYISKVFRRFLDVGCVLKGAHCPAIGHSSMERLDTPDNFGSNGGRGNIHRCDCKAPG